MFEGMGTDERAVWGEFVRRVEGRPSGKPGSGEELALHGTMRRDECSPTYGFAGAVTAYDCPSPPPGMPHINGHVPVYDPSLADKDAILSGT
ncbi:hypothetical protein BDR07DRAFT_1500675 [Suillus spraguei]|nr:hypothetical protein BDR07DRAFT_1500675 [Suillus spraguei]